MGLLRIYSIAILIFQLYGVRGENLPKLDENKLLLNDARYPPPSAIPLYKECSEKGHFPPQFVFTNTGTLKPSEVLTNKNIFKQVPFTSAVVPGAMETVEVIENKKTKVGGIGKLGFAKMEYKSGVLGMGTMTVYALHVHPRGEYAYWLPQGGFVDIPRTPTNAHPKYVFTTDFSGCSWTVTPLSNGYLRLRHVNGDKELPEFNSLSLTVKGGTESYAMQYKEYGYIQLSNRGNQRFENGMAYAFMQFSGGAWKLYAQQKTCAPFTGNPTFKNGDLVSIKMTYSNKDHYDMISGMKDFSIP